MAGPFGWGAFFGALLGARLASCCGCSCYRGFLLSPQPSLTHRQRERARALRRIRALFGLATYGRMDGWMAMASCSCSAGRRHGT